MGILPVQEPEACTTFINGIGLLYQLISHFPVASNPYYVRNSIPVYVRSPLGYNTM
jgi:hypothetical protein